MLKKLSTLLSVTLKTTALCRKLCSTSSTTLGWPWLYLMPFSIPAVKNTSFHCIICWQPWWIENWNALAVCKIRMNATAQPGLEGSNNTIEHVWKILTKSTWTRIFLITVMEIRLLLFYYHSLYAEKRSIMPALCSRLRVHYYAQNNAGIMYLTLDHAPLNEEFIVCSGISRNQRKDLDCI